MSGPSPRWRLAPMKSVRCSTASIPVLLTAIDFPCASDFWQAKFRPTPRIQRTNWTSNEGECEISVHLRERGLKPD